ETLARLGAPPGAMQPAPEREQRPSPLERHRPLVVERERGGEGRLEIVVDHPAPPGCRFGPPAALAGRVPAGRRRPGPAGCRPRPDPAPTGRSPDPPGRCP